MIMVYCGCFYILSLINIVEIVLIVDMYIVKYNYLMLEEKKFIKNNYNNKNKKKNLLILIFKNM